MISVILPSRKRVDALKRSISSLRDTAIDPSSFEVWVAFDDDDVETRDEVWRQMPDVNTIIMPKVGYERLHEYYNRLAGESKGEWIFQWNDDAIMMTPGWDEIIHKTDKFCCIGPVNVDKSGRMYQVEILFPIVPRKYFELLGHLSLNRHTDSWIYFIFNDLGLTINSDIKVFHDRPDLGGGNDDDVYKNRKYDIDSLFSEETMTLKHKDLEKIKEYLNGNTR